MDATTEYLKKQEVLKTYKDGFQTIMKVAAYAMRSPQGVVVQENIRVVCACYLIAGFPNQVFPTTSVPDHKEPLIQAAKHMVQWLEDVHRTLLRERRPISQEHGRNFINSVQVFLERFHAWKEHDEPIMNERMIGAIKALVEAKRRLVNSPEDPDVQDVIRTGNENTVGEQMDTMVRKLFRRLRLSGTPEMLADVRQVFYQAGLYLDLLVDPPAAPVDQNPV